MIGLNNVMRTLRYPKKAMLTSGDSNVNIISLLSLSSHFEWGMRGSCGNGYLTVDRNGMEWYDLLQERQLQCILRKGLENERKNC